MKKELDLLAKFSKNKNVASIDATFKVERGSLVSTDLESYVKIKTSIGGSGVYSISEAKKILTKYPSAHVTCSDSMVISEAKKTFKLSSMANVDDFPIIPLVENKVGTLSYDKETTALWKFVGKDELRVAMTGLGFKDKVIVATDAHRMRWLSGKTDFAGEFILPPSAQRLPLGEYDIYEDKEWIRLSSGDIDFYFRKIDARYPDYNRVIPSQEDTAYEVIIPTKDFNELIDDCLMVANDVTRMIVLRTDGTLSAEDIDSSRSYSGKIPLSFVGGEPFNITFNGVLMKTCITEQGDNIHLRMFSPRKAILVNDNTLQMPLMMEQ
jgi:DNA polymerase III sliding clamp (beta) subunit (PCNA family)